MKDNLLYDLGAAESWSVSYRGEVYDDARKRSDIWYFHRGLNTGFDRFEDQESVRPICKNPTRKGNRLAKS